MGLQLCPEKHVVYLPTILREVDGWVERPSATATVLLRTLFSASQTLPEESVIPSVLPPSTSVSSFSKESEN